MSENIRAAIIGGSEDGKTFLASGFSRGLWKRYGMRSIVFDPFKGETNWGPQALVLGEGEFAKFRHLAENVSRSQRFAFFWDEGTSTGGRERENLSLFTRIRHNSAAFFFIGHGYATMLPIMRGSLTHVFLAVRPPDDADEWAKVMVDESIRTTAPTLKQYEFLAKRKHHPSRVLSYTKNEILAGIVP